MTPRSGGPTCPPSVSRRPSNAQHDENTGRKTFPGQHCDELVLYGVVPQQALLLPRFDSTPPQQIWVDALYGAAPQQALLLPRLNSVLLQQICVDAL